MIHNLLQGLTALQPMQLRTNAPLPGEWGKDFSAKLTSPTGDTPGSYVAVAVRNTFLPAQIAKHLIGFQGRTSSQRQRAYSALSGHTKSKSLHEQVCWNRSEEVTRRLFVQAGVIIHSCAICPRS
jgi:hypothetical protein